MNHITVDHPADISTAVASDRSVPRLLLDGVTVGPAYLLVGFSQATWLADVCRRAMNRV